MPLPLKDFPRSGEDVAQRQKGDKVSPKVTERAHPLPCGELPPQRLRGLSIGEARKKCNGDDRRQRRIQGGAVGAAVSRTRVPLKARSGRWAPQPVLAKRLAFFRFDLSFGVERGEQPLVCNGDDRRQRRIQGGAVGAAACRMRVPPKARSRRRVPQPVGSSASKSPCPCRAKHAAFASQTGLRLKSPTGAFMPSGHRRPFWFSFVRQKRTSPPCEAPPKMHPNCKSKMQAFCVSAQKNCIFIFCPETLQKALTTAFPHAILNT